MCINIEITFSSLKYCVRTCKHKHQCRQICKKITLLNNCIGVDTKLQLTTHWGGNRENVWGWAAGETQKDRGRHTETEGQRGRHRDRTRERTVEYTLRLWNKLPIKVRTLGSLAISQTPLQPLALLSPRIASSSCHLFSPPRWML